MILIALCCTWQSRAPNIDRCTPEIWPWPWPLFLTLKQGTSDVKWFWHLTYDLDLQSQLILGQSNRRVCTNRQTHKRIDGRTLPSTGDQNFPSFLGFPNFPNFQGPITLYMLISVANASHTFPSFWWKPILIPEYIISLASRLIIRPVYPLTWMTKRIFDEVRDNFVEGSTKSAELSIIENQLQFCSKVIHNSVQLVLKVVLEGYCRCPDSHDLSECHHLYDLGRHV